MTKNGKPTKANKTKEATASDTVYTKFETAKFIVDYFNPIGTICEPMFG